MGIPEPSSVDDTAQFVRLAIPMMAKHSIPITPMNYTIWYNYVVGINRELNTTLDNIMANGEIFTSHLNEKIYQQFFANLEEETLDKIKDDIKSILINICKNVSDFTGNAELYETTINLHLTELTDKSCSKEIREIVSKTLEETKKIMRNGLEVKEQLDHANKQLETLKAEIEKAKNDSLIDFLTGIPNRKAFNQNLNELIHQAKQEEQTVCLLMIDVDHFKNFNDQYGHLVGDQVLQYVSNIIKENIRGSDFVSRFGGEEFAVILPNTDLEGAISVAENIQFSINEKSLKLSGSQKKIGKVSVSIGLSQYRLNEPLDDMIDRSDKALYLAKNSGRNCIKDERLCNE